MLPGARCLFHSAEAKNGFLHSVKGGLHSLKSAQEKLSGDGLVGGSFLIAAVPVKPCGQGKLSLFCKNYACQLLWPDVVPSEIEETMD